MNSDHEPHLAGALEPDQLTMSTSRKLPRRKLGRFTVFLLYALRIYVLAAIPIVIYAFVQAVHTGQP